MSSAQRYVGIALDVSASMHESLSNMSSEQLSRFLSIMFALRTVVRGHRQLRPAPDAATDETRVFAYLFGTTVSPSQVCDLFSLLAVARSADRADQAPDTPIGDPYQYLEATAIRADRSAWITWIREELRPEKARTLASNLHRFGVAVTALGNLLPAISQAELQVLRAADRLGEKGPSNRIEGAAQLRFASPSAWRSAHRQVARSGGSEKLREQIHRAERIARLLASRRLTVDELLAGSGEAEREILHFLVENLPTTLLTPPEIAELLEGPGGGPDDEDLVITRFSAVVGGSTPLCAVLAQLERRFRECQPLSVLEQLLGALAGIPHPTSILVIVSDGLSTDGDPRPVVEHLRSAGVLVVCCYVTSKDVVRPRTLVGRPRQRWDEGARMLFECASPVADGPVERGYLRRHGWKIEPHGRFFSQVNHSTYVSELLSAALG